MQTFFTIIYLHKFDTNFFMYIVDIVDDHKMVTESIGKNINFYNSNLQLGTMQYTAHEYLMYLKAHTKHKPDVVLIDYRLPGLLGWHLSYILEQEYPTIKKIGISGSTMPKWINNFLLAGCKTFISKDVDLEELTNGIHTICQNKNYFNTWFTKEMVVVNEAIPSFPYGLTDKEFFYIHLCQTNLTNTAIASVLNISFETEHKMQKKLYKRFEVQTRAELESIAIDKKIICHPVVVD